LIEPETAGALALAPALSLELAAGLVSVLGAALGAAVAAPPLLQAPNANVAATANAATRFVEMITRWFLLRGRGMAA